MSARIRNLILQKLTEAPKYLEVDTFPVPLRPFWAPQAAILYFAGIAALQGVSEYPLRR